MHPENTSDGRDVDRTQAENIVRGISGIIGVQNTLRVER